MMGNGTAPSRAEWAIYLSLTLFGVHQQGHDPKQQPMHQKDQSFGSSVAHLVTSEDDKDRMVRRFNIAATATDIKELSHHLRGIIQLLRAEGIALDYAQLSNDLYLFQDIHHRSNVCLRWGQDFYRVLNHITEQEEEHTDE